MRQTFNRFSWLIPFAALAGAFAGLPALAGTLPVAGQEVRGETGDGTMNAAAARAYRHGPLPVSDAFVKAKEAANAALRAARKGGAAGTSDAPSARAPAIVSGFAGKYDINYTPPDTTGATGPTRYVQMVNAKFAIYDRTSSTPLASGTLNGLAGFGSGVSSFDPQIIWDPTTNRFYYAMDSIVSSTDNRIAFGFSKSHSPSGSGDWCKYSVTSYGSNFPDFPKLGDNRYFMLIGVNVYDAFLSYLRSDLLALPKPLGTAAIGTCPSFASLMNGRDRIFTDLRDSTDSQVWSPTPANGIDTVGSGYVVANDASLPATELWVLPVTGPSSGLPVLGAAGKIAIPTADVPAGARQPSYTQLLDTSDTRMTQAVMARNPNRSNALSLWTQHTVKNTATSSKIQWYEIRPTVSPPVLLRSGTVKGASTEFFFNAAISPDRRIDGSTVANGGSFIIGYNVSSPSINPRIVMGASLNGAAVSYSIVRNGGGPYRDFSCPSPGDTCRWGDYSGAAPDPRPQGGKTRAVGLTNQFSPSGATSTGQSNWRTWIWHAAP